MKEMSENELLISITKEYLRNNMKPVYYLLVAKMTILQMIQEIPEMWKDLQPEEFLKKQNEEKVDITQVTSQEKEDQGSNNNNNVKPKEMATSSKGKKKKHSML